MGGFVDAVVDTGKKAVGVVTNFITGGNPLISLGISLF